MLSSAAKIKRKKYAGSPLLKSLPSARSLAAHDENYLTFAPFPTQASRDRANKARAALYQAKKDHTVRAHNKAIKAARQAQIASIPRFNSIQYFIDHAAQYGLTVTKEAVTALNKIVQQYRLEVIHQACTNARNAGSRYVHAIHVRTYNGLMAPGLRGATRVIGKKARSTASTTGLSDAQKVRTIASLTKPGTPGSATSKLNTTVQILTMPSVVGSGPTTLLKKKKKKRATKLQNEAVPEWEPPGLIYE